MLGNLFTQTIVVPGTLAANLTITFKPAVNCTLLHVSAGGSNANNGLITIGKIGTLEAYLASASIGDSDTPAEFTKANFVGAQYPHIDKGERLMYGHSQMTHAMVFTGVDLDTEDRPRKWRVENSWSEKAGDKGFFQMSDAWFDEFNYEVVVRRSHVPAKSLKALERKPVELEPWDPMGSLA